MTRLAADVDAVVVGAGPNGLAAAICLARAGLGVRLIEGASTAGGGTRSAALTLPGFVHDVCSTAHPLAVSSPFFRSLDLAGLGLQFDHPALPFAHPLDGGRAAILHRDVDLTAAGLGGDGPAYRRLIAPLVRDAEAIVPQLVSSLRPPFRQPRALATFAVRAAAPMALLPAASAATRRRPCWPAPRRTPNYP